MEKKYGSIVIFVKEKGNIQHLNEILTRHAEIIIGRQGIPVRDKSVNIISLVVEGTIDEINSLTGQLGKLHGITARAVLVKE
ncbi:MAG: hypothetical protein JXB19_02885 [Bacteroidales bacterium]|nr:hypothetical protein [Bacteroidales bacterium]